MKKALTIAIVFCMAVSINTITAYQVHGTEISKIKAVMISEKRAPVQRITRNNSEVLAAVAVRRASSHIKTRQRLREIYEVDVFNDLISRCILTDDEKAILRLHYLKGKDLRYIGDELGFSESTVKRKHHEILEKLNKLL